MAVTARELPALDVCRPFSRAQARAAGIRLREILGPEFHKILYDSYVSATVLSPLGCERGRRSTFQCPGLTSATRRPLSYGVG